MTPIPRVVDISHHNVFNADVKKSLHLIDDMKALQNAGIWGFIHKATQGLGNTDKFCKQRIAAANDVGLLTGYYHFNTGDNIPAQVRHFFDVAEPNENTLMCLDWEDNKQSQMGLDDCVHFLQLADEILKRPCWLYSGNRAKHYLANVDASKDIFKFFARRYLWGCQYGPVFKPFNENGKPLPWKEATLWQFTGDGVGPLPHTMPGIVTHGIDINHYSGSLDQLKKDWVNKEDLIA